MGGPIQALSIWATFQCAVERPKLAGQREVPNKVWGQDP